MSLYLWSSGSVGPLRGQDAVEPRRQLLPHCTLTKGSDLLWALTVQKPAALGTLAYQSVTVIPLAPAEPLP